MVDRVKSRIKLNLGKGSKTSMPLNGHDVAQMPKKHETLQEKHRTRLNNYGTYQSYRKLPVRTTWPVMRIPVHLGHAVASTIRHLFLISLSDVSSQMWRHKANVLCDRSAIDVSLSSVHCVRGGWTSSESRPQSISIVHPTSRSYMMRGRSRRSYCYRL